MMKQSTNTPSASAAVTEPPTSTSSIVERNLSDVKVALWGFGNQNKLMAKYLHERHVDIVAVISHHDIGKDYTLVDLVPWGNKLGGTNGVVIVDESDARSTLEATRPDICILFTRSTLRDLQPSLVVCAECNVNVITIAEELYDSSKSSPTLTRQVDALFRQHGVTLTGSGYEDVACCQMILTLSSMMHRIDSINGFVQYNLNDYGKVLAEAHGAGLTPEQFQTEIADNSSAEFCGGSIIGLLLSPLGLTLKETTEKREPTFCNVPVWAASLDREIPVGECTGMKAKATTKTNEGITIEFDLIGNCYGPDDIDQTSWEFQGEPSGVKFTMPKTPSVQMTNTAVMSRILQVIDAPAGYLTVDKLPAIPPYQHWT